MFTLKIKTDNSAFTDIPPGVELARILRKLADRIGNGEDHGRCLDINGNIVGEFKGAA